MRGVRGSATFRRVPIFATRAARWFGILALGATAFALALTEIDVSGGWKGLYLLHGTGGAPLELADDVYLGEGPRVIGSVPFDGLRRLVHLQDENLHHGPWLELDWDDALARGLVRNHLGDGTELVTMLSRWDNGGGDGGARHGVFIGGSVPDVAVYTARQNESGMAFRERSGTWRHVWCNANEAIWDVAAAREIDTWQYRYLGSQVLVRDAERVVIESTHEADVGGVPLRMSRVAQFAAGKPYLLLGISLENIGTAPVRYMFLYGDEPWVGNFGNADGNLGWTSDGVFADEAAIDPVSHRWAGIVDTGSGTANFLAWIGREFPTKVYVSNDIGELVPGRPLASDHIFIGTEWHQELMPGEVRHVLFAIGMAERDAVGNLRPPRSLFARKD